MSGSDVSDGDSETEETRKMVTQQNKKKKKSGGFQSMGEFKHQAGVYMCVYSG